MKLLTCVLALPALLLTGCGEKSSQPSSNTNAPAAGSGSALTTPADYLNSAVKQQKDAIKTIDTTALNKAIELFQVQEGKLPKDLEELVAKKYIPEIPKPPAGYRISYNQTKGVVTLDKL